VGLKCYLPKEVDESNGEKEILKMRMRNDIQKETYKLQQIEAILEILGEELDYLNLMLLYVGEYSLNAVFLQQVISSLILEVYDPIYYYSIQLLLLSSIGGIQVAYFYFIRLRRC
jgi:hypothetical protein